MKSKKIPIILINFQPILYLYPYPSEPPSHIYLNQSSPPNLISIFSINPIILNFHYNSSLFIKTYLFLHIKILAKHMAKIAKKIEF